MRDEPGLLRVWWRGSAPGLAARQMFASCSHRREAVGLTGSSLLFAAGGMGRFEGQQPLRRAEGEECRNSLRVLAPAVVAADQNVILRDDFCQSEPSPCCEGVPSAREGKSR